MFGVVSLLTLGCKSDDVEKASLALATREARVASVKQPPSHAGGSAIKVYVDASRSMQGFAGCSTQPTEFNATLDRITADLAATTVIRFGERGRGSGDVFESVPMNKAVNCPAFYDRLQNPDYALYKSAIDDSAGSTILYFTDGVQSDWSGSNPGPSLGLLQEWVKSGKALAIMSFRSRFAGPVWSEQAQRMLPKVTVTNRPFYVFVMAQSEKDIDALFQKLSASTLATARQIRFAADAVDCKLIPGEVPKYKSTLSPPWALVEFNKIKPAQALLRHQCVLRREYPVGQLGPRVELEYRQWRGGRFGDVVPALPGLSVRTAADAQRPDESTSSLKATLPFDNAVSNGWYLVRVAADPGKLRSWVDSLSTDSDSQSDAFDRTYRFSWLIEQLVRTHLAKQPSATYGLTIKYR